MSKENGTCKSSHSPSATRSSLTLDFNIFRRWLEDALEAYPDPNIANNTQLVLDPYNVVDNLSFPPLERLRAGAPDAYDVVMLTGSKHTAYDKNSSFGPQLIEWMRNISTAPEYQHVKIIGVCYGHQIMSLALGGECEQGTNGWEVGVYGCEMTEQGHYYWSDSIVPNGDSKIVSQLVIFLLTSVRAADAQGCGHKDATWVRTSPSLREVPCPLVRQAAPCFHAR